MPKSTLEWIVFVLVAAGGLNWGLVGAFGFNLVSTLVGFMPLLERIVYILVGVATIMWIMQAMKK